MARDRTKLELSLFPFLNILFGLIAVLILHIFFILQMNRAEGTAIVRTAKAGGNRGEGEEFERRLSERLGNLREQIADVDRRRHQAEAELEQRRLLLELRKRQDLMPAAGKGTAGVPIGAPVAAEWRMIPIANRGTDSLKIPILVEVRAGSYVVHEFSGKSHKTVQLPGIPAQPSAKPGDTQAPLQPEPRLKEFLDNINRQRRDRYLLFLIRPDGIESYDRISDYCKNHYPTPLSENLPKKLSPSLVFDFGYEPYSDQWLLVREAAKP